AEKRNLIREAIYPAGLDGPNIKPIKADPEWGVSAATTVPATAEEVERAQALALLTTPPPKLNRRPVKLERASSTELTPKTSKAVQECLGRAKTADLALSTRGAAATAKAKARPSPKQSPKPSLKKPKKDAKTIGKPCKADKEEHEEEDCSATASEESSSSDKKRKGSKTKRSKSPARQVDSDQEE
ncbi:unnamed protein product, partial [Durusdinium trenchii]